MNKYKICPVCQAKNSPAVLECTECGSDLMGVRVVEESPSDVGIKAEQGQKKQQSSDEFVRICDCGQENAVSARKCIACGEDISDVIPVPREEKTGGIAYYISSVDGEIVLHIECPSEHIVGRENELSEYLQTKSFVSRTHAKLTATSEGLFLQNLSQANGTYVNNEKIDSGKAYKLCAGDEIGLGGFVNQSGRQDLAAYFVVGTK